MEQRDSGNARTWRERLERWRQSGLSGREFSEREGVSSSTLYYWSRRLDLGGPRGRQRRSSPAARRALLPVVVTHRPARTVELPTATTQMLEVVVLGGEIVRVPPGFDDDAMLVRVLRALGDRR